MYKRDRRRAAALFVGGGIALAVCAALVVFLVYTLALRTEYRKTCFAINDAILAARGTEMTVERGGERWPLDEKTLAYYNQNLLERNTVVFDRRQAALNEKSILLYLGENRLSFTGLEDGSAINIRWETPEETRSYTVRSSMVTFSQYSAYLSNYVRRLG